MPHCSQKKKCCCQPVLVVYPNNQFSGTPDEFLATLDKQKKEKTKYYFLELPDPRQEWNELIKQKLCCLTKKYKKKPTLVSALFNSEDEIKYIIQLTELTSKTYITGTTSSNYAVAGGNRYTSKLSSLALLPNLPGTGNEFVFGSNYNCEHIVRSSDVYSLDAENLLRSSTSTAYNRPDDVPEADWPSACIISSDIPDELTFEKLSNPINNALSATDNCMYWLVANNTQAYAKYDKEKGVWLMSENIQELDNSVGVKLTTNQTLSILDQINAFGNAAGVKIGYRLGGITTLNANLLKVLANRLNMTYWY